MFGINPGQFLSPEGMLYLYKNLECTLPSGLAKVSVNQYKNANHKEKDHPKSSCDKALELRMALLGVVPDTISNAGGNKRWYDVFSGKGSPWAIVSVLEDFGNNSERFIARHGKDHPASASGKCARFLADDTITWEQTMQAICDEYFGLDCNGFTGNWMRIVQPEAKVTPDSTSHDVMRSAAKDYRSSLSAVEYWDICAYVDNKHIMAINRPAENGRFWVCQSAGGGPRMNEHMITQVNEWEFKLTAPTADDYASNFYILTTWSS